MKAIILSIFISLCTISLISAQQDSILINDQEVISWLKENAQPLNTIEAGNGYNDLSAYEEILKEVSVVGLGESTHGTSEFFKLKHRMIEFLVSEMGFTHFVIESSSSAAPIINDYILNGKGDVYKALTAQNYILWDMKEFVTLLEWMKNYNLTVDEDKKVKFYGMDLGNNNLGREQVLDYLKKYAPEKYTSTDSLFSILSVQESKWPFWGYNEDIVLDWFPKLQAFIHYIINQKDRLISISSKEEWNRIYRDLQLMEQWVFSSVKTSLTGVSVESTDRYHYMGQNLNYLIDKADPDAKFMVWASNDHINRNKSSRVGGHMKKRFGDGYYALALECYQGASRTQKPKVGIPWAGELGADTINTNVKTVNWYLHETGINKFFLDLRGAQLNEMTDKLLSTKQNVVAAGWKHNSKGSIYQKTLKKHFDGILFIDTSTPSHPTENAMKRANVLDN